MVEGLLALKFELLLSFEFPSFFDGPVELVEAFDEFGVFGEEGVAGLSGCVEVVDLFDAVLDTGLEVRFDARSVALPVAFSNLESLSRGL